MKTFENQYAQQQARNRKLLAGCRYLGPGPQSSSVIPFTLDAERVKKLGKEPKDLLLGLEISAARTAIKALASLAKINELDHLGGALDLIPALTLTLALADFERVAYTIENAHTSIGYYSVLAAYGYLDEPYVVDSFRRGLDIAGHVSWLPGGTPLNGGRLGVMVPVAAGHALGKKARYGREAWMITHCGDAGWISGQALNGYNIAALHRAPLTLVMHRNGIQLSGATHKIMDLDPRLILAALGVEIIEIKSLHQLDELWGAYREARALAARGKPSLIYPVGYQSDGKTPVTLRTLGKMYGIAPAVEAFTKKHGVSLEQEIWIPGALMSYRDVEPMLENVFLANDLPGGKGHHDGHLKGRDAAAVLANPMLQVSRDQEKALEKYRQKAPRLVITAPRPAPGTPNLLLESGQLDEVATFLPGKPVSPRAGAELAYDLVAKHHPARVFVVSCDLDSSTKLARARKQLAPERQFEVSIEEQAAALVADGLASLDNQPRLVVMSTFAAFFEGIAREGLELWRYQRNLTGSNEGLNVAFHLSHVGASTGRDHFSGWSLDWINLALGYLPYLDRFYAPADANAAFIAVRDLAARSGAHLLAIPREELPVLNKPGTPAPLWDIRAAWSPVTALRSYPGARRAILALGAPASLAAQAAEQLSEKEKLPTDAYVINGLPLPETWLEKAAAKYAGGLVTIEDGLIGTPGSGIRGFAGLVRTAAAGRPVPLAHLGINDPRVAPSDGHHEVWAHFGITRDELIARVKGLRKK